MVDAPAYGIGLEEEICDKFPFLPDFQYSLIRLMMENEEFGVECVYHLKKQYFANYKLGWFIEFFQQFYNKYGKLPNDVVVKNEIAKFDNQEDRLEREIVYTRIKEADVSNGPYIMDKLTNFVQDAIFKRAFDESRENFNRGDGDAAKHTLKNMLDECSRVDFKKDTVFNFNRTWELIDRLNLSLQNRIPLGIPPIDEALIGGLAKKQVMLWLAGTNVGKSVILVNCLVNFVKDGTKVLYIDLENDEDEVPARILSCYTGINYNRLYRPQSMWTPEEKKKVDEASAVMKERAIVKPWHDYNITIEDFVGYVERKKKQFDFDVLIVDYAQLLHSSKQMKSEYSEHGAIFRALATMAIRNDIVVMTTSQGNRMAQMKNKGADAKKDLLSGTDVADSFEVIRKTGVLITATRSKKMMQDNEIVFLLDKQRRGKTDVAVKFYTDFDSIRVFNKDMKYDLYGEDAINAVDEYTV